MAGVADYALYRKALPWDHSPRIPLLTDQGGRSRTFAGAPYQPQATAPKGLIAAADRATYDLVRGLIGDLPGL